MPLTEFAKEKIMMKPKNSTVSCFLAILNLILFVPDCKALCMTLCVLCPREDGLSSLNCRHIEMAIKLVFKILKSGVFFERVSISLSLGIKRTSLPPQKKPRHLRNLLRKIVLGTQTHLLIDKLGMRRLRKPL